NSRSASRKNARRPSLALVAAVTLLPVVAEHAAAHALVGAGDLAARVAAVQVAVVAVAVGGGAPAVEGLGRVVVLVRAVPALGARAAAHAAVAGLAEVRLATVGRVAVAVPEVG